MHTFSIAQLFAVGLLVTAPLASAFAEPAAAQELSKKYVVCY
jgi:hypothetical protein